MADTLTLYKLIILYILSKVDYPLTNSQISEFIIDKGYTSYFIVQQALSELIEAEFIKVRHIRTMSHYLITDAGLETLEYFGNQISQSIKDEVDEFLNEHHYELRTDNETIADYYMAKPGQFIVNCMIKEKGSSMIDLQLNVTSEEQAVAICDNWKKKNADIYSFIISQLLTK